jgi:hypothetical protein
MTELVGIFQKNFGMLNILVCSFLPSCCVSATTLEPDMISIVGR